MTKYWFRRKRFGYGATPCTWEGWTLTVTVVLLVTGIVLLGPVIRDGGGRVLWLTLGTLAVIVPFSVIAWFKTEGGWRWRSGND